MKTGSAQAARGNRVAVAGSVGTTSAVTTAGSNPSIKSSARLAFDLGDSFASFADKDSSGYPTFQYLVGDTGSEEVATPFLSDTCAVGD